MKRILLALALAGSFALPASAQGACTFGSLATGDFGLGSGFLVPSTITYGLDTTNCALEWKVDAPACCNVFVTQHFLAIGSQVDPVGIPLGSPFLPGTNLHIGPAISLVGAFPGVTGAVGLPADPSLIGVTIPTQAAVEFFTTIGLTLDYGLTQGVTLTLMP